MSSANGIWLDERNLYAITSGMLAWRILSSTLGPEPSKKSSIPFFNGSTETVSTDQQLFHNGPCFDEAFLDLIAQVAFPKPDVLMNGIVASILHLVRPHATFLGEHTLCMRFLYSICEVWKLSWKFHSQ